MSIGMIASTRMACPNLEQESKFLEMLNKIDTYNIDGNMLLLIGNGEVLGVMEAE